MNQLSLGAHLMLVGSPGGRSRYDGLATWYDSHNATAAERNRAELLRLLGTGGGLCLELGCGTGHYFDAIRQADVPWWGWTGPPTNYASPETGDGTSSRPTR